MTCFEVKEAQRVVRIGLQAHMLDLVGAQSKPREGRLLDGARELRKQQRSWVSIQRYLASAMCRRAVTNLLHCLLVLLS